MGGAVGGEREVSGKVDGREYGTYLDEIDKLGEGLLGERREAVLNLVGRLGGITATSGNSRYKEVTARTERNCLGSGRGMTGRTRR